MSGFQERLCWMVLLFHDAFMGVTRCIQLRAKLVQDHLSGTLAKTIAGLSWVSSFLCILRAFPCGLFSGWSAPLPVSLGPQRTKEEVLVILKLRLRTCTARCFCHFCHTLVVKTVRGQPRSKRKRNRPTSLQEASQRMGGHLGFICQTVQPPLVLLFPHS